MYFSVDKMYLANFKGDAYPRKYFSRSVIGVTQYTYF